MMEPNVLGYVFLFTVVGVSFVAIFIMWKKGSAGTVHYKSIITKKEIIQFEQEAEENQPYNSRIVETSSHHELISEGAAQMQNDGYEVFRGVNADVGAIV